MPTTLPPSVLADHHPAGRGPRTHRLDAKLPRRAVHAPTAPGGDAVRPDQKRFLGPVIAVNLQHDLHFGVVNGGPRFLRVAVVNVGAQELSILAVERIGGSTDFSVPAAPTRPAKLAPGGQVDFTVAFDPTTPDLAAAAVIQITSSDPTTPELDLLATGQGGAGAGVRYSQLARPGVAARDREIAPTQSQERAHRARCATRPRMVDADQHARSRRRQGSRG